MDFKSLSSRLKEHFKMCYAFNPQRKPSYKKYVLNVLKNTQMILIFYDEIIQEKEGKGLFLCGWRFAINYME